MRARLTVPPSLARTRPIFALGENSARRLPSGEIAVPILRNIQPKTTGKNDSKNRRSIKRRGVGGRCVGEGGLRPAFRGRRRQRRRRQRQRRDEIASSVMRALNSGSNLGRTRKVCARLRCSSSAGSPL